MRKVILLLMLPFVHLSALRYQSKPLAERYHRLQQWCRLALHILGLKLTVKGQVPTDTEATYLVSNHQGTIDPLLIIASCPHPVSFVSKEGNRKLLGIGKWGELIDLIYFDCDSKLGNISMLRQATKLLQQRRSVLIFPEGTRSKSDAMHPFKSGALKPACLAKASITPITLNGAYALDVKGKIKELSITYHQPIPYDTYQKWDIDELANHLFLQIQSAVGSTQ